MRSRIEINTLGGADIKRSNVTRCEDTLRETTLIMQLEPKCSDEILLT